MRNLSLLLRKAVDRIVAPLFWAIMIPLSIFGFPAIWWAVLQDGEVVTSMGGALKDRYNLPGKIMWNAGNLKDWPDGTGRDASLDRCWRTGTRQLWAGENGGVFWQSMCIRVWRYVLVLTIDATEVAERTASRTRQNIIDEALKMQHDG